MSTTCKGSKFESQLSGLAEPTSLKVVAFPKLNGWVPDLLLWSDRAIMGLCARVVI